MSYSLFNKPTNKLTDPALLASMDDHAATRGSSVETIEIHKNHLFPDPNQPRKWFDSEMIERRRTQMEKQGQESPITVLPGVAGEDGLIRYQIVDGECRWRACQASEQLDYLRAEIYQGDPADPYIILITQLTHNNDGSEILSPVERAASYQRLIDVKVASGIENPKEQVAQDIGMDNGEFSRLISLNDMPSVVEEFALTHGIGDTRTLNGLVRVSKFDSADALRDVFFDIERNEKLKEQGGEARPLREIVSEAIAKVKLKSPRKGKTKEKKIRLLSAKQVQLHLKADLSGVLTVETPRETIKLVLSAEQVTALKT